MPAPISRDSMSRCEVPSMSYDVSYVPPKAAIDPASPSLDTIETTQQRLNREVMERFQNTSSRVPHHSFVFVAQTGKYLFLAIMLPTYICFFGIPRWLIMNALPQIFGILKNESVRIGRFFSELSKRIVDLMKGAMEQLIGDSLKMLNHQSKKLLSSIVQKTSSFAEKLNKLKDLMAKSAALPSMLASFVKKKVLELKESILKFEKYQDRVLFVAKKVVETTLLPFDLFDKLIIEPLYKWTSRKMDFVLQKAKIACQFILQKWVAISHPVVSIIKTVTRAVFHPLYNFAKQALERGNDWLQPRLEEIKVRLNSYREKISKEISKIAAQVRTKVKELSSSFVEIMQPVIQLPIQLSVQFLGWAWWKASENATSLRGKFKGWGNSGKRTFTYVKSSFSRGGRLIYKQIQALSFGIIQGLSWIAKGATILINWIIKQVIDLPRKIIRTFVRFSNLVVRIVKNVFYGFRVIIAWIWVLFSYGMQLVRELSREIGSWFRI